MNKKKLIKQRSKSCTERFLQFYFDQKVKVKPPKNNKINWSASFRPLLSMTWQTRVQLDFIVSSWADFKFTFINKIIIKHLESKNEILQGTRFKDLKGDSKCICQYNIFLAGNEMLLLNKTLRFTLKEFGEEFHFTILLQDHFHQSSSVLHQSQLSI